MNAGRLTKKIPEHLLPYIAQQDASLYTPMDHAGWRFILKLSRAFFSQHAHAMYLQGLEETGISTEQIPLISEMDRKLRRFQWRAVPVCGFIPPAVFMEFLSLGILPIACDMRRHEHLAYTPAPDIVHEAAGHAPIIADPAYAAYLRQYGEISRKAIFSSQDWAVYTAIRELSDVKENPASSPSAIAEAQHNLERALAAVDHVSEATELARMSWWTIEYGLIGKGENAKIYGAGLLSSVSESFHCLDPEVRKLPLTLECVKVSYDITRPQPQLFVAPDFAALTGVLEELATTMAFRRGGREGLEKARRAATVTTAVLETGLQLSGKLVEIRTGATGEPVALRYEGPCQLALRDQELRGHGPEAHPEGMSVLLDKGARAISRDASLTVEGNVVAGYGSRVVSVFGGAADRPKYLAATGGFHQPPRQPKTNLTETNAALNDLYARVREIRDSGLIPKAELTRVHSRLEAEFPEDWLLRYELLELNHSHKLRAPWEAAIRDRLALIGQKDSMKAELIERGLRLLG